MTLPPTALTLEEQSWLDAQGPLTPTGERWLAVIRRLDMDLVRARAEIDKLAPAVLALEEQVGTSETSLRVLRELMGGERLEVAVMERDELARALEEVMALIDEGWLVRNTTNDAHFPSFAAESVRLVMVLKRVQNALAHAREITNPKL